jgi:uncharacterized protein YcnI
MPTPKRCFILAVTAAIAALAVVPASAHVTLENRRAAIGSAYRAIFVVPHGCAGSATIRLRVQIPEGVIAEKPAPKPGWDVDAVVGRYTGEYQYRGAKVAEGVKEVAWSGGKLPDKTREEFVIDTFLTEGLKPNTTLYFPVVQECEQGVSRWIEIPPDGAAHSHEVRWPAPGVTLMPRP